MNEVKKYKAKIVKCPKCYQILELEGVSKKSIHCAMQDLYVKIESHLSSMCFSRNGNKNERIKVPISISTTTETTFYKIKTECEDNNFLLL